MHSWIGLGLIFLSSVHLTTANLSSDEKNVVLSDMNTFRGSTLVEPSPANMQLLVWNEELAAAAQTAADRCVLASDPDRASQVSSFDTVGENLSAVGSMTPNLTNLVESGWFNQRGNFNYTTNSCSSSDACRYYLQIVWAATIALGCASTICPTIPNFPISNSALFICYFGPEGNVPGKRPFTEGAPCSDCLEQQDLCINNLCSYCRNFTMANARISFSQTIEGIVATYYCNDGYTPSNVSYSSSCNGSMGSLWVPQPEDELNCTLLDPVPTDATVTMTTSLLTLQPAVTMTTSQVTLQPAVTMTPIQVAQPSVNCGQLILPPSLGSIGNHTGGTTEGATVTFKCNHSPNTTVTATCSREAVWEPNPQCDITTNSALSTKAPTPMMSVIITMMMSALWVYFAGHLC